MNIFKKMILLVVSLISFVWTVYVVGKLMIFLSTPAKISLKTEFLRNLLDSASKIDIAIQSSTVNIAGIVIFILQHSLMKWNVIKSMYKRIGISSIERAIYCFMSSTCLWYLMNNWKPTPFVLWQFEVVERSWLWWIINSLHISAWTVIYFGSIIMDLPEILGMKQVYYDIMNYGDPMMYKTYELRFLYGKVRHPSFTGLTFVLWATNYMTVDRFILSIMLTIYMFTAWNTDMNDVVFYKKQLARKKMELESLF